MVTVELVSIAPSPSYRARTTNSVVEPVARWWHPLHLPVLVDCFSDPLGVRIPPDRLMEWINENNLEESVRGIFPNPVRIHDLGAPRWYPARSSAID